MNQKWKTADDLIREMDSDPAISQRLKENADDLERRIQASNAALEPAVRHANESGYLGETVEEILKLNAPLPRPLVNIFLSSLCSLSGLGPRQQESIVRALGGAANPFDASPLIDVFNHTQDYALRWAVVNTFALTNPNGVQEWFSQMRGTHWEKTFKELTGER